MITLSLTIFLGISLGIIVGILPGIGLTSVLVGCYPILMHVDLQTLFVFYCSVLATTQFFGSVPAIIYGVCGEVTSIPASTYGHRYLLTHGGSDILAQTATGSLIGALFGIFLLYCLSFFIPHLTFLISNYTKSIVFLVALVALILQAKIFFQGIVAAILGLMIGQIGFNPVFNYHFLSSSNSILDAGLPVNAVFTGLIIVPALLSLRLENVSKMNAFTSVSFLKRLKLLLRIDNKMTVMRSAVIGALVGFIPGLSYVISSSLSASIEEQTFKGDDAVITVAAETANNSSAITSLIPLILFGIPITSSEAIILSLSEMKGFSSLTSGSFINENINNIVGILVLVSVICWLLSGLIYTIALKIYNSSISKIYDVLLLTVLGIAFYSAYSDNQIFLSFICLIMFSYLGTKIKHTEIKTIIVLSFFLSSDIISEFYRFYLYNF